jgi:antibiotic biosynthesis monooxygenase (ABM) superfamily enzyme
MSIDVSAGEKVMAEEQGSRKADEQVTVVFRRTARPGRERDLERWIAEVGREARQFPGHLGQNVVRPVNPAAPEYTIIVHFASPEALRGWLDSEVRARHLEEVNAFTVGEVAIESVQGMEYWFEPARPNAPPKWKMVVVIFIVLYPLAVLLNVGLKQIFDGMPDHLRQLIAIVVTVVLMTYLLMPAMTKLLRRWLNG